jgi:hypothetical protein
MRTRLTLPSRFGTESRALAFIRDNALWCIGPQVIAADESGRNWRVVIDTAKPDAVCRYMSQRLPGIEWQRSELP